MGRYYYPQIVLHGSETPRGRVSERRTLSLLGLGQGCSSLRNSDALMRVAVPRRRGPAGLRDLFRFCRSCGLYALRSGPFRVCEAGGWYHYPQRALRAAETPDARLSKRLICRFLASPIYICERPCRIEKDRLRFR